MRFSKLAAVATSGTAVYVLAVACSGGSAGGGGFVDAMADALGAGGSGGFLADVLTDPVDDAKAAPPEIKEGQCTDNGGGNYYAEIAFPGRTVNELARATALLHSATSQPSGYDWAQAAGMSIRDGSVRVYCYSSSGSYTVDLVRVVLPLQ